MRILKWCYERMTGNPAPYYFDYSILTILAKPVRKWLVNTVAADCPFNCVRIWLYRLCGIRVGKHTFIGMKCYLDDMCHDLLVIGANVTVSYGVFFACHGKGQVHMPIVVEDHAYIGMRANVISKNRSGSTDGVRIGEGAVIGACSLVNCDIPPHTTAVGVPCRICKSA